MQYEAFKLRSVIFDDKSRIERKSFEIESNNSIYEFMVHDIGHNALDISAFFKYRKIVLGGPIENQLADLISKSGDASVLRSIAFEKRPYNESVHVDVNGDDYTFKIDGIGPQAIKITIQITYDEIATSTNALESILRNLISTIYASKLSNSKFIEYVDMKWDKQEAERQRIREEVLRQEEIKAQKQKELEEFLKF